MLSPAPSRSSRGGRGRLAAPFLSVAFLMALVVPLPVGAVSASGTVIVQEGRVIEEDLFAAGSRVIVNGRIEGDLIVSTTHLTINGVVEGDVGGLAWSVDVPGEVLGSVRAVAWDVDVSGSVGDDVLVLARSLDVDGSIGRDMLVAGVSAHHSGTVEGEIRGELLWGLRVDGAVGEDVDVGIHRLTISDSASVGSAVSWRQGLISQNVRGWTARTDISEEADLGLVAEVEPIPLDISVRALRLLFQVLRFVALLFTGLLFISVLPRFTRRSAVQIDTRPSLTFLVGAAVFVLVPVLAVVSVFTVVLAPVALMLFGLWLFGLFAGAIPALIAIGNRAGRSRYGLVGSFVTAAIAWRILRLLPLIGLFIYFLVVIWGMGAWTLAMWTAWREGRNEESESDSVPASFDDPGPRLELLGLEVPRPTEE